MRLIHGGLHHTSSNPIRSKTLSSSPPLCITPMGDVCCPPLYFVLQFIVSRRASEVTNHKSTVSAHSRVQQQPSYTRTDAVLYIHTPNLSHTASSQETLSSNTGTYKANIRRKNKSIHSLCSSRRTDSQDLKSNQTNIKTLLLTQTSTSWFPMEQIPAFPLFSQCRPTCSLKRMVLQSRSHLCTRQCWKLAAFYIRSLTFDIFIELLASYLRRGSRNLNS